ncbi:unnamed protein product [Polarella glacialis]|nr:unnamed protein product [Polarella glacialis]
MNARGRLPQREHADPRFRQPLKEMAQSGWEPWRSRANELDANAADEGEGGSMGWDSGVESDSTAQSWSGNLWATRSGWGGRPSDWKGQGGMSAAEVKSSWAPHWTGSTRWWDSSRDSASKRSSVRWISKDGWQPFASSRAVVVPAAGFSSASDASDAPTEIEVATLRLSAQGLRAAGVLEAGGAAGGAAGSRVPHSAASGRGRSQELRSKELSLPSQEAAGPLDPWLRGLDSSGALCRYRTPLQDFFDSPEQLFLAYTTPIGSGSKLRFDHSFFVEADITDEAHQCVFENWFSQKLQHQEAFREKVVSEVGKGAAGAARAAVGSHRPISASATDGKNSKQVARQSQPNAS